MTKKIFISHSSKDKELINDFIRLLQIGMNISKEEIFCTSLVNSIKPGKEFISCIKNNIETCQRVIFILTRNYLDSHFCMAEMGAAWALNQSIVPIIVSPLHFNDLDDTPLMGIQALNIHNEEDLTFLYDYFCDDGIIRNRNTSDFNAGVKEFLSKLTFLSDSLLRKDDDGYYTATIEKKRDVPKSHYCYKINGYVEADATPVKGETHWIMYFKNQFGINDLSIGSKVRFKVKEVRDLRDFNDLKNTRNIYLNDLQIIK